MMPITVDELGCIIIFVLLKKRCTALNFQARFFYISLMKLRIEGTASNLAIGHSLLVLFSLLKLLENKEKNFKLAKKWLHVN